MIEILLGGLLLSSTAGIGNYLLRRFGISFDNQIEEWSFSCTLGLGVLALAVLMLGVSHLLYGQVLILLSVVWIVFGAKEALQMTLLRQGCRRYLAILRSNFFYVALASLAVGGGALTLVRALAPPHGATDPLAYQLALPKIFLIKHHLSFEPTITGALYPTYLGLLYLVGIGLKNGILAQLIHLFTSVLCSLAICGFCIRYFNWRVGIFAGSIFSFVPIVVIFGAQGYVDIGLCLFQFMAFAALANWIDSRDVRMLVLAGIMSGFALGTKHQGLPTAFVGSAAILIAGFHLKASVATIGRNIGIFLVMLLCVSSPWYIRSLFATGNPIWPLANDFFAGSMPFGSPPSVGLFTAQAGDSTFLDKLIPDANWFNTYKNSLSPWSWTFSPGGFQKAVGVYFVALIPGIMIVKRTKAVYWLVSFCAVYYLILIRFLHMNPRYGLVMLAFSSVVAGLAAERLASIRTFFAGRIFKVSFFLTIVLNLTWSAYLALPMLDVALSRETREEFLTRNEPTYRLFEFVNDNLKDSDLVLLQGIVRGFYCEKSYLWDHPHQSILRYEELASPEELLAELESLHVTHIARMIRIPAGRIQLGYPQYFLDDYHEEFRRKYLTLIYRDDQFVLFSIDRES